MKAPSQAPVITLCAELLLTEQHRRDPAPHLPPGFLRRGRHRLLPDQHASSDHHGAGDLDGACGPHPLSGTHSDTNAESSDEILSVCAALAAGLPGTAIELLDSPGPAFFSRPAPDSDPSFKQASSPEPETRREQGTEFEHKFDPEQSARPAHRSDDCPPDRLPSPPQALRLAALTLRDNWFPGGIGIFSAGTDLATSFPGGLRSDLDVCDALADVPDTAPEDYRHLSAGPAQADLRTVSILAGLLLPRIHIARAIVADVQGTTTDQDAQTLTYLIGDSSTTALEGAGLVAAVSLVADTVFRLDAVGWGPACAYARVLYADLLYRIGNDERATTMLERTRSAVPHDEALQAHCALVKGDWTAAPDSHPATFGLLPTGTGPRGHRAPAPQTAAGLWCRAEHHYRAIGSRAGSAACHLRLSTLSNCHLRRTRFPGDDPGVGLTEAPGSGDAPDFADAPSSWDAPDLADTPGLADVPSSGDAPDLTDAPSSGDAPDFADTPDLADAPGPGENSETGPVPRTGTGTDPGHSRNHRTDQLRLALRDAAQAGDTALYTVAAVHLIAADPTVHDAADPADPRARGAGIRAVIDWARDQGSPAYARGLCRLLAALSTRHREEGDLFRGRHLLRHAVSLAAHLDEPLDPQPMGSDLADLLGSDTYLVLLAGLHLLDAEHAPEHVPEHSPEHDRTSTRAWIRRAHDLMVAVRQATAVESPQLLARTCDLLSAHLRHPPSRGQTHDNLAPLVEPVTRLAHQTLATGPGLQELFTGVRERTAGHLTRSHEHLTRTLNDPQQNAYVHCAALLHSGRRQEAALLVDNLIERGPLPGPSIDMLLQTGHADTAARRFPLRPVLPDDPHSTRPWEDLSRLAQIRLAQNDPDRAVALAYSALDSYEKHVVDLSRDLMRTPSGDDPTVARAYLTAVLGNIRLAGRAQAAGEHDRAEDHRCASLRAADRSRNGLLPAAGTPGAPHVIGTPSAVSTSDAPCDPGESIGTGVHGGPGILRPPDTSDAFSGSEAPRDSELPGGPGTYCVSGGFGGSCGSGIPCAPDMVDAIDAPLPAAQPSTSPTEPATRQPEPATRQHLATWLRASSHWHTTIASTTSRILAGETPCPSATRAELDAAESALAMAEAPLAFPNTDTVRSDTCRRPLRVGDLVDPEVVSRCLAPGDVLLEYHHYDSELVVFALTRDGVRIEDRTIQPYELQACVQDLYTSPESSAPEDLSCPAGRGAARLRELLLDPVRDCLSAASRIIVVPSGPLSRVPWPLLPVDQIPLGERCPVSCLPASGLVAQLAAGGPVRFDRPALVLGGACDAADDADRSMSQTQPLAVAQPAATAQAHAVAGLYGVKALVGQDATVRAVVRGTADAPLGTLHLACPGRIDGTRPHLSHLSLGPGERLDLGDLLAACIDCDLVVLSACTPGEFRGLDAGDLTGLSRALFAVGVRHLVMPLWPVDDEIAHTFAVEFHRRILDGTDVARAVHETRHTLRTARTPGTSQAREPLGELRTPANAWASWVHVGW